MDVQVDQTWSLPRTVATTVRSAAALAAGVDARAAGGGMDAAARDDVATAASAAVTGTRTVRVGKMMA